MVDFGLDMKVESDAFWKISHIVGPAWESLQSLLQQMHDSNGTWEPFDLVVIDADKSGMLEYFEMLTEIRGFMSDNYLICVDMKPFKGQLSTQKLDKSDSWLISSGQSQIDALRRHVAAASDFEFRESDNLLRVCRKVSATMACNPLSAFPNCYANPCSKVHWAAPREGLSPAAELRRAAVNADWSRLFDEGQTQVLAWASWSASEDRCTKLQELVKSIKAKRILEIGSFCGVASLVMAEALPEDGQLLSLEIDPFLADFGTDIKRNSHAFHKITHMIGAAQDSLRSLVKAAETERVWDPFDLVVIDADKASMMEYFRILWGSPGMLQPGARVCVDVTPFRCQLFRPYVKGKIDDFIVKSGQESIDAFVAFARSLSNVGSIDVVEDSNLVVLRRSKLLD
jgi:caffeoyl-CoA O-methyltransferase